MLMMRIQEVAFINERQECKKWNLKARILKRYFGFASHKQSLPIPTKMTSKVIKFNDFLLI